MHRRPVLKVLAPVFALAVALTACGKSKNDTSSSSSGKADCSTSALHTLTKGKLTVGTDSPAYEPWFVDDKPSNGKGYESAVAYAVAKQLGFAKGDVTWTKVPFDNSYAPGAKTFDFDINQVSISPARAKVVDFSDGYYDVNQAVVAFKDSKAAGAKSVSDLKGLKFGAQVGTTSLDFINDVIKPGTKAFVYNDNNAAKAALQAKQVDAIVLDLPTAIYVSAAEIEGTEVLGQFPSTGSHPEQFGMVFQKGNSLRDCVNQALATLKSDGELAKIKAQYLSGAIAPEISLK